MDMSFRINSKIVLNFLIFLFIIGWGILFLPKTAQAAITSDFTTINACDDATQWIAGGQADTPTDETTTKKEGTGSVNLGKNGVAAVDFYYDYTFTAINLTGEMFFVWLFIDNQATLNLLNVARIYIYDGSGNWRYWNMKNAEFTDGELQTGWNITLFRVDGRWTAQSATAPTLTNITQVRIYFETPNATDTIAVGSLKIDYWHYGTYIRFTGTDALLNIYNTNITNAWGAIQRQAVYWGGTGPAWRYQYKFSIKLQAGDGSTATSMSESKIQILFHSYTPLPAFHIQNAATVTITDFLIQQRDDYGQVIGTENGSTVTFRRGWIGEGVDNTGDQRPYFYGSITLENIIFYYARPVGGSTTTWNITRVTKVQGGYWTHFFGTNNDDIYFSGGNGVQNDYNVGISGTVKNLKMRNVSSAFYRGYYNQNYYVINGDIDNWTFVWAGTNPGKTYRQYEFDLQVLDKNNNPISGATVTLKDKDGNQVFSIPTDTNGELRETGTATGGGSNYLDDTNKNWATNNFVNWEIEITAGTGVGQIRYVTSNTATRITIRSNWTTNPDATSQYRLKPIVSYGWYEQATGNTLNSYSPHELTISKAGSGYQTYTKKFTLDEKIDWRIKLKPAPDGYVKVFGTEYASGESGSVYVEVLAQDGTPVNTATVTFTLYDKNGNVVTGYQDLGMTYITGSDGKYRPTNAFTAPSTEGVYIIDATAQWTCDSATCYAYGSGEIHVSQTANKVASMVSDVWSYSTRTLTNVSNIAQAVWEYSTRTLTSFGTLVSDIWSNTTRTLTSGTSIAQDIWNATTRKLTSREITIGDYIAGESSSSMPTEYNIELVRKATFDFAGFADSGSTTSTLVDSEISEYPDDYWNNYEVIIMSGANIGLKRVACDFDRATYTITLCDAFPNSIASGDKYVIAHERKLVHAIWNWSERTLTSAANIAGDIWGYSGGRTLTAIGSLAADIWNDSYASVRKLTSRQIGSTEEYIASQAKVQEIRTSQQAGWTVYLSDVGEVLAGQTYRAKLWVLNYESVPTDSYATPTVTIYDASRNKVVENVATTKLSNGIYEYTYSVPSSAAAGVWETEVSTEVESGKVIKTNDYWEVEASAAEVKINAITDNTVPSIVANATITNEGTTDYEYHYEYCVVDTQENRCGGGDDVDYALGAKLIAAGQSWTTDLTLTVTTTGVYWYKLVVYWGTEKSVAIQQFNAVSVVTYALTVSKSGTGSGTVTSSPAGINCGADCTENYTSGTIVTLTATATAGSDFAGWSGACSGTGSCLVTMAEAKSVTATFNLSAPPSVGGGGGPAPLPPVVCKGADFNLDGIVNSVDFSILLFFWKTQPPFRNSCVDINKDGRVDSVDFSILLYQWGKPGVNIF